MGQATLKPINFTPFISIALGVCSQELIAFLLVANVGNAEQKRTDFEIPLKVTKSCAQSENRTRVYRVAGGNYTTKPTARLLCCCM